MEPKKKRAVSAPSTLSTVESSDYNDVLESASNSEKSTLGRDI